MFNTGIGQIVGTFMVFFVNQITNTYLFIDMYFSKKRDVIGLFIGVCVLAMVVGIIMYSLFLYNIKAGEGNPLHINNLGDHGTFVNNQFKKWYVVHLFFLYFISFLYFTLEPQTEKIVPTPGPIKNSDGTTTTPPDYKLTGLFYPFFYLNFPDKTPWYTNASTIVSFVVKVISTFILLFSTAWTVKLSFDLYKLDFNFNAPPNTFDKDKNNYDDQQYLAVNTQTNAKNTSSNKFIDYFKNINLQFLSNYSIDLGL
jgi:hypothetical protein